MRLQGLTQHTEEAALPLYDGCEIRIRHMQPRNPRIGQRPVALPVLALTSLVMSLDAWHRGAGRWLRTYALAVAASALLVSTFLVSAGLVAFRPWAY